MILNNYKIDEVVNELIWDEVKPHAKLPSILSLLVIVYPLFDKALDKAAILLWKSFFLKLVSNSKFKFKLFTWSPDQLLIAPKIEIVLSAEIVSVLNWV